MDSLSTVLLVLAAAWTDAKASDRPVGLRPLGYEAAATAARIERKPMLLLFCEGDAGCQRIARDMLAEIKLRQWLDEKFVAFQVDTVKSPELVERYRVRRTPTYLFVDAKGVEMDRIVGARESKALRAEGEEILKGGDPLERLEKKRKGRESDPEMRLRRADILCDRGDLDTALAEYLAVHAQGGALGAEAFQEILRMARIYPAAADAVGDLAAKIEPRVRSAEAGDDEFAAWFGLCSTMRFETRMLSMYDALADVEGEHAPRASELRARIAPTLRDLFYTDRRYADLGPLVKDARAAFEARKAAHAELAARDPSAAKSSLRLLREDTARDYETLVALRRASEATLLADALIGFDTTVETYDALIEAAQRAENVAEAKLVAQRGRADARLDAKARMRIGPTIPHERK